MTGTFLLAGYCAAEEPAPDPYRDAMAGYTLDAKAAAELESLVARTPDDLSARTKLLGYYSNQRFTSGEAQENHRKHVLWIIRNHPEADIAGLPYCGIHAGMDREGYTEGKKIWVEQTQTHAQNAVILGHAATFVFIDDKDLAEKLLLQAREIEPANPYWPDQLGRLYSLQSGKDAAGKAFLEYEKAQAADPVEMSRFYRLDALAKSAFNAENTGKATQYATESLKAANLHPTDWNHGNAIHHGNNVLGRVALKKGDIKLATEYLLKAGASPGSPQLDSFGPSMRLAQDLLEKGETESVLQYLELCRKFWEMGGKKLDEWALDVKAGKNPEFSGNLLY